MFGSHDSGALGRFRSGVRKRLILLAWGGFAFVGLVLVPCLLIGRSLNAHYGIVDGRWCWTGFDTASGHYANSLDADEVTFVVLEDQKYARDAKRVYFRGRPIPDADPATFAFLPYTDPQGKLFSKDRSHVFREDQVIAGADPGTYQVIDDLFGRDRTGVFRLTARISGADPATFEIVQGPELTERYWSRDARNYYHETERVEGADYATFQPTDDFYARDKDHEFRGVTPYGTKTRPSEPTPP